MFSLNLQQPEPASAGTTLLLSPFTWWECYFWGIEGFIFRERSFGGLGFDIFVSFYFDEGVLSSFERRVTLWTSCSCFCTSWFEFLKKWIPEDNLWEMPPFSLVFSCFFSTNVASPKASHAWRMQWLFVMELASQWIKEEQLIYLDLCDDETQEWVAH